MTDPEPAVPQEARTQWKGIVEGNINSHPGMALQGLDTLVGPHHMISVHFFQFLMYSVLEPLPADKVLNVATPLSILFKALGHYGARPLVPFVPSLNGKEWLKWPNGWKFGPGSKLRRVRARMENCSAEFSSASGKLRGVWALLFERSQRTRALEDERNQEDRLEDIEARGEVGWKLGPKKGGRKGKSASRQTSRLGSHGLDEEEEENELGLVTPAGWQLLQFLVALWEQDVQENNGTPVAFLAQLWRGGSHMLYSQAEVPIEIIRQAAYDGEGAEGIARRRIGADLLRLLVSAATCMPTPRFHPQELMVELLPVFRNPRVALLVSMLNASAPSSDPSRVPWYYKAFLLWKALEDAAGVREQRERNAQRKSQRERQRAGHRSNADWSVRGKLGDGPILPSCAPTPAEVLELLDLEPPDPDASQADASQADASQGDLSQWDMSQADLSPEGTQALERRIRTLKTALLTLVVAETEPPSALWARVDSAYAPYVHAAEAAHKRKFAETDAQQEELVEMMVTEETVPLSPSSASRASSESVETVGSVEAAPYRRAVAARRAASQDAGKGKAKLVDKGRPKANRLVRGDGSGMVESMETEATMSLSQSDGEDEGHKSDHGVASVSPDPQRDSPVRPRTRPRKAIKYTR